MDLSTQIASDSPVTERSMAWLMSLVLHLVVTLIFGLAWRVAPRGVALEPERAGGIVLASTNTARPNYYSPQTPADASEQSSASAAADREVAAATRAALPAADGPPVDFSTTLPSAASLQGLGIGLGLPDSSGMLSGGGQRGTGKDGRANTYVFGARGTGTRFLYVFDRSASMEGFEGRPIAAARSELLNSLKDLEAIHQFQIVFYNERPAIFNPFSPQPPRMMFGDEKNKQMADIYVRSIKGLGGTRHMEALKLAIGLSPDVIFFLTDADEPQLTVGELAEITRMNDRIAATLNTIQFGAGPDPGDENFLKRLARMNRGQHVYVDVTAIKP